MPPPPLLNEFNTTSQMDKISVISINHIVTSRRQTLLSNWANQRTGIWRLAVERSVCIVSWLVQCNSNTYLCTFNYLCSFYSSRMQLLHPLLSWFNPFPLFLNSDVRILRNGPLIFLRADRELTHRIYPRTFPRTPAYPSPLPSHPNCHTKKDVVAG